MEGEGWQREGVCVSSRVLTYVCACVLLYKGVCTHTQGDVDRAPFFTPLIWLHLI